MHRRHFLFASSSALAGLSVTPLRATTDDLRLVMVEQAGCIYCRRWHEDIGHIYPKTPEGRFAPLDVVDMGRGLPDRLSLARRVNYTPTFVLTRSGAEVARIEGYPGEDFFWGLLGMMLKAHTSYTPPEA